MKQEQIDQLQALYDAGTQGEWTGSCVIRFDGLELGEMDAQADAELVTTLHNLAPALNINVFSDAETETCSYYSEHRAVIKQAEAALGKESA